MKKYIAPILLISVFLFLISPVSAWSVTNHHQIAIDTYNSLPADIQNKLDLDAMENGSDDPDTVFFDFNYHCYPNSKIKAEYWLMKGKKNYDKGNFEYASYCYGVATHYISDGLCGPHSKKGASKYYHSLYEIRAMFLSPKTTYYLGDFDSIIKSGHKKSLKSWNNWIKEGDDANIQKDLNRASSVSYSTVKKSILS